MVATRAAAHLWVVSGRSSHTCLERLTSIEILLICFKYSATCHRSALQSGTAAVMRAGQTASRPLHSVMSSATGVTAILSRRRGASWIICSAGPRRHTDTTTDRQLTGKREDVCAAARRRGRRIKFRQLQLKMHKQNKRSRWFVPYHAQWD